MDGSTAATLPPADAPRPAAAPYPPRYGWTKRFAVFSMIVLLVVAAVWAAWRQVARRRLARELNAIAARGEPVRGAELAEAPLADEQNAAVYLRRAFAAVRPGADPPAATQLEYPSYPPYPPAWHRLADAAVAAHGEAFRHARAARAHDRAAWGLPMDRPTSSVVTQYLHDLNRLRHLANLLGDTALHQHLHGDDAAAIELLRDGRHLARSADQQPVVVYHLVAIGVDAIALDRTFVIAAGLTINPDDASPGPDPASLLPATRPSRRPATRAQVRALIAELLADAESAGPLRRAVLGDRAFGLAMIEEASRGARLLRPMLDLDAARVAGQQPLMGRATTQPTWPAARAVLARQQPLPPPAAPPGPAGRQPREAVDFTRVLSGTYGAPWLPRAVEQDFRIRAERRMAAVSLAAQLYRADHGAAWPPSLQALVPQYLPAAPQDPFAADGRPLGYVLVKHGRPDGTDRPVVYTVADDGADQTTASPTWAVPVPASGWISGVPDQWRDLSRWTPPTPPPPPAASTTTTATQAVQ